MIADCFRIEGNFLILNESFEFPWELFSWKQQQKARDFLESTGVVFYAPIVKKQSAGFACVELDYSAGKMRQPHPRFMSDRIVALWQSLRDLQCQKSSEFPEGMFEELFG